jgi:hypothetical protein
MQHFRGHREGKLIEIYYYHAMGKILAYFVRNGLGGTNFEKL